MSERSLETPLPAGFYGRSTLTVARELLGMRLVRESNGVRRAGLITEVEAYLGLEDTASHAAKGRTPRTSVMFGPPGRAYVYLIYGIHCLLNLVAERDGQAGAVLIRGLLLQEDGGFLTEARPLSGPGRVARALAIDRSLNGLDLTLRQGLWLETGPGVAPGHVQTDARIGIPYAQPEHRAAPWRFYVNPAGLEQ